jgi:aryl-alcohol dehydrogenase-like predicted oxidoreductase
MQFRMLGRTGIEVGRYCLGAMMFDAQPVAECTAA